MNIRLQVTAVACTVMIAHALSTNGPRDSWAQGNTVKEIAASDIWKSAQIIGRLGRPLGQLVTIRGKWIESPRAAKNDFLFSVESIDGRRTSRAVVFSGGDVSTVLSRNKLPGGISTDRWDWKYDSHGEVPVPPLVDGEEWELHGIETGGFMGYTQEVWKKSAR